MTKLCKARQWQNKKGDFQQLLEIVFLRVGKYFSQLIMPQNRVKMGTLEV